MIRLLPVALCFLCASCSSSSASPSQSNAQTAADAGNDGDVVICTGADTYVANMQKPGASGVFNFTLVSSTPAPPAQGNNTWILNITDSHGQPVTNATLTVTPTMPLHGHGSSIVPQITPQNGGYQIASVYLFMAGLWAVQIDATSGTAKDSVTYTFCITG